MALKETMSILLKDDLYVGSCIRMATKQIKIEVTLVNKGEVADIIAASELAPMYDAKNAELKLKQLENEGITQESLAKYFLNLQVLVCKFAEDKRKIGNCGLRSLGFHFSELRGLYLPTLTATILSQVGDVVIGNYRVEVVAPKDGEVDRNFVIEMSEKLFRNRHLLFSERDQIGNANAVYNADFMANVICNMSEETRQAEVVSKDGTNPDVRLKLMAVLAGINLVNASYQILYPVVDYIDYGQPGDAIALKASGDLSNQTT